VDLQERPRCDLCSGGGSGRRRLPADDQCATCFLASYKHPDVLNAPGVPQHCVLCESTDYDDLMPCVSKDGKHLVRAHFDCVRSTPNTSFVQVSDVLELYPSLGRLRPHHVVGSLACSSCKVCDGKTTTRLRRQQDATAMGSIVPCRASPGEGVHEACMQAHVKSCTACAEHVMQTRQVRAVICITMDSGMHGRTYTSVYVLSSKCLYITVHIRIMIVYIIT
jgi:hypothetical protein